MSEATSEHADRPLNATLHRLRATPSMRKIRSDRRLVEQLADHEVPVPFERVRARCSTAPEP